MLLVVHACLALDEPGALYATRRRERSRFRRIDLLVDRHAGDAHRTRTDRVTHVGHRRLDDRHPPQTGQPFADHAVPSPAWLLRTANGRAPRTGLLAHPAHGRREQARLATCVGHLVVGERAVVVGITRCGRIRQPVGRPMIGKRWPLIFGDVALRSHVGTDAIGDLAPRSIRDLLGHQRERPVRLAGVILRVHPGDGRTRCHVVGGEHCAAGFGLGDEEPRQSDHQLVLACIARLRPPVGESSEEERGAAGRRIAAHRPHRSPVVVADQSVTGPLEAAIGESEAFLDAVVGGHVQTHHRSGVAHDVVVVDDGVGLGAVLVQPRAIGVLVTGEPIDRLARRLPQPRRRDLGTVLGRRHDAERETSCHE